VVGGRRKKRLAFRKGARRLAATGKRGPPKGGRSARREAAREGILALKRERPELGAAKICAMAGSPVSAPTALAIIREEFPAPPGKAARKATGSFCMGRPNELWQIDYVDLGSGMHLLSVPDGCSRKILSCDVRRTSTTDDVLEILEAAISRHGAPERILSDHGTQWYSTVGGRCRFDEWCGSRGIGHSMGRIGKPTTQGKVERWHGSLRRECRLPPAGSGAEEFSEAVGAYVAFYNSERPHWSLGLRTPDSAYYGA
jgi:transposase InsO family protein